MLCWVYLKRFKNLIIMLSQRNNLEILHKAMLWDYWIGTHIKSKLKKKWLFGHVLSVTSSTQIQLRNSLNLEGNSARLVVSKKLSNETRNRERGMIMDQKKLLISCWLAYSFILVLCFLNKPFLYFDSKAVFLLWWKCIFSQEFK